MDDIEIKELKEIRIIFIIYYIIVVRIMRAVGQAKAPVQKKSCLSEIQRLQRVI